MKYIRILLACASEVWCLEQAKLKTLTRVLLVKSQGGETGWVKPEGDQARVLSSRRDEIISGKPGVIGQINVFGTIMQRANMFDDISGGVSTEAIAQEFRTMLRDPDVKMIIFNFDSPGGSSFGIEELAQEIFDSRGIKPILAQVNPTCASAAYWLACQCDEISVTPSGSAGSVGVYTIHEDISAYLEKEGFKETLIQSSQSPFKVEGNEYEPLSEEAKAFLQSRVDNTARKFIAHVARGREVDEATVKEQFGGGRMFDANELVRRGMVDRIGSLDDTLERFGIVLRPSSERGNSAKAQSRDGLLAKLAGGERPTEREWERGLQGLGLSNSQAVRAVAANCLGKVSGDPKRDGSDPKPPADDRVSKEVTGLRDAVASFSLPKLKAG